MARSPTSHRTWIHKSTVIFNWQRKTLTNMPFTRIRHIRGKATDLFRTFSAYPIFGKGARSSGIRLDCTIATDAFKMKPPARGQREIEHQPANKRMIVGHRR